ncbi:hypothetical protein M426DRAFT_8483 [Hypoxylon sp. CI-4A]|nr:hypothetical protein M426DRAFT_8483 [Hypoxylon sp. CI-4A]
MPRPPSYHGVVRQFQTRQDRRSSIVEAKRERHKRRMRMIRHGHLGLSVRQSAPPPSPEHTPSSSGVLDHWNLKEDGKPIDLGSLIPKPAPQTAPRLDRLPVELTQMIYEACDPRSQQHLTWTCRSIRNKLVDIHAPRIRLEGPLENIMVNCSLIMSQSINKNILRNTTLLTISVIPSPEQSGAVRLPTDLNPTAQQIDLWVKLVRKMQALKQLTLEVDVTHSELQLLIRLRCQMWHEQEEVISRNHMALRLRGFESAEICNILYCFPNVHSVELNQGSLDEFSGYRLGAMRFPKVTTLRICTLRLSDNLVPTLGLHSLKHASNMFPNLQDLIIGDRNTHMCESTTTVLQWDMGYGVLRSFRSLRRLLVLMLHSIPVELTCEAMRCFDTNPRLQDIYIKDRNQNKFHPKRAANGSITF